MLASDGFFLNIGAVLLRLCAPFIEGAGDKMKVSTRRLSALHGCVCVRD